MSILNNKLLFCFIYLSLGFSSIYSEIESVTLNWTSLLCTQTCITQLEKEFRKVPGIAEASLNQGAGAATIKWRPNIPFSFSDVNVPMRLVGLSVRDIHIKVKGTISHDSHSVTLTSMGDGSRFQLLNPIVSRPGQQAPVFNLAARQLSPELRQQLIDTEAQQAIVTIQGQIFMPGRSSAQQIVVDSLHVETPKPDKTKSGNAK